MRKNVASQNVAAQMNARSDGSPLTSSVSVLVTVDNGTQSSGGGTTTHKGNGHWNYAPTQAETNGNHIAFTFTHSTGVNQTVNVYTVSFDPHDTVRLGLTALPNAAAAASGGLHILGTNATAVTYSGGVTISNASGSALTLSSGGGNGNGLNASGNGTGHGILGTGGATGNGVRGVGGATSGAGIRGQGTNGNAQGIYAVGQGSAAGLRADGGATGNGISAVGGGTSGNGINITTTSGHGINIAPVGTNMHGIVSTGGNGGTSDGIKGVAGTGGVDIRGNITGNLTGNVSGSVGSVTTITQGGLAVKKNTALSNFAFIMYSSTDHVTPTTGLTVTATRSIDGAAFGAAANSVTELSNGVYLLNLANTDLNGDVITFRFTASGADDTFVTIVTT